MGNHQNNARTGNFIYENKMTEQLGKSRNNSTYFDDFDFVRGKFNYRVAEVKIWHNNQYVTGIQTVYEMDGTKKSPGAHQGTNLGTKCEVLTLQQDEFISGLLIRSGEWIDSITIQTNKGRSITGGGQGGSATTFQISKGYQFVAFNGATSQYLDTFQATFDNIF